MTLLWVCVFFAGYLAVGGWILSAIRRRRKAARQTQDQVVALRSACLCLVRWVRAHRPEPLSAPQDMQKDLIDVRKKLADVGIQIPGL